MLQLMLQSWCI